MEVSHQIMHFFSSTTDRQRALRAEAELAQLQPRNDELLADIAVLRERIARDREALERVNQETAAAQASLAADQASAAATQATFDTLALACGIDPARLTGLTPAAVKALTNEHLDARARDVMMELGVPLNEPRVDNAARTRSEMLARFQQLQKTDSAAAARFYQENAQRMLT